MDIADIRTGLQHARNTAYHILESGSFDSSLHFAALDLKITALRLEAMIDQQQADLAGDTASTAGRSNIPNGLRDADSPTNPPEPAHSAGGGRPKSLEVEGGP